jgi:hypothetical protein
VRILFDQGVPAPLRDHLTGHHVTTAYELGWSKLSNGELLSNAEERFDVLITTDQNLRHQQQLAGRRLGVLVLPTTSWPVLQTKVEAIVAAIGGIKPGQLQDLE